MLPKNWRASWPCLTTAWSTGGMYSRKRPKSRGLSATRGSAPGARPDAHVDS